METTGNALGSWMEQALPVLQQLMETIATWYEENREKVVQACHDAGKPEPVDAFEHFRASVRGQTQKEETPHP